MFTQRLHPRHWPIAIKLGALLVVLTMLPLAVMTYQNSVHTRAELLEAARTQNWQRARATALSLDAYLENLLASVRLTALSHDTLALLSNPSERTQLETTTLMLRQMQSTLGLDALYLTDAGGHVLAASEARLVGRSYVAARFFLDASAGQTAIDEMRYDPEEDRIYLHFSAPVRNAAGVIIGAAIGRIEPSAVDRIIANDRHYRGRGDFGVLWSEEGIRLSHGQDPALRFLPFQPLPPDVRRVLVAEQRFGPQTSDMLAQASDTPTVLAKSQELLYDANADPFLRFESVSAGMVQAAIAPLTGKRWLYGILTPEATLLATQEAHTWRNLQVTLLVGLLALGSAVIAARRATRPIATVAAMAHAIAAGKTTRRIELHRRDEIGQLANAFDAMAESLVVKEEQLRRHAQQLEARVEERTAQLSAANTALQEDVAARTRSEAHIAHLNDVLRAMRAVGQLIAHERDGQRLLQEACALLVQTRGYRMAWAGLTTAEQEPLPPAAAAGQGTAYIAALTGPEPSPGGASELEPSRRARQSRQAVQCPDIAAVEWAPWREAALACDLRAAAAAPMLVGARLWGVIAVYTDQPRSFDQEEITLLGGLANDLAFALQSIGDEASRKQAEAALAASEAQYRTLAEAAHDQIYVIDRAGVVEYVNRFAASAFGCLPQDLIGQQVATLFPPEVGQQQSAAIRHVLATGQPYYAESITRFPGGEAWLGTWLSPLFDETGGVRAVLGVSRNISERKYAEAQVAEQLVELRRWHDATLGREERMLDLKREVNELLSQLRQPPRYTTLAGQETEETLR